MGNEGDAPIPAKPAWLLRVPTILEEVRSLPSPVLDRPVIEKLFRLRRRQAISLCHAFGGFQAGRTFLVDRLALIECLEAIRDSGVFRAEAKRRTRFVEDLAENRRLAPGKKIRVAAAPDTRDRRLADLPAGIHLRPGELRIEFFGTEDLLRHLFDLSQAILNDYERFQEIVEE